MADGPKLENLNLKPAPPGEPIPVVGNLPKVYSGHWMDIETAPMDGSSFLVSNGDLVAQASCEKGPSGEHWDIAGYAWPAPFDALDITHWTHLPEAP